MWSSSKNFNQKLLHNFFLSLKVTCVGWDGTAAQNFISVSNIRASMNYLHPEGQEIQPFKNFY